MLIDPAGDAGPLTGGDENDERQAVSNALCMDEHLM